MIPADETNAGSDPPMTAASFAHDIRQSLFAIHMAVRLLERSRENEQQFIELCRSIEVERQRASDLINRLLEESKPE